MSKGLRPVTFKVNGIVYQRAKEKYDLGPVIRAFLAQLAESRQCEFCGRVSENKTEKPLKKK